MTWPRGKDIVPPTMKRLLLIVLFAFFVLTLFQKEAHVSQIHPQDRTLEELVGSSTYILVVEKLVPPVRYETITKFRDVTFKQPQKIAVHRFKVLEKLYSIYAEDKMPLVGKDKGVYSANYETALEVQAMYEKDGTMKSPYYSYYKSSIDFDKESKMIIFVRRSDDFKLKFVADGAYESFGKREQIEELAKKEKSKRTGYTLNDTYGEN
jgi:hypothetical protein